MYGLSNETVFGNSGNSGHDELESPLSYKEMDNYDLGKNNRG